MAEKKKTNEVKVEKKFCTNCGKELKEGEVCECINSTQPAVSINTDALVNTSKSVFRTIVDVFKKPATTINEEINKKDNTVTIILTVCLAISFAFVLMALVSSGMSAINSATLGLISTEISYFRVFIYGIFMYALMAVIPMFAAFVIAKIAKNNLSFKKAFKLYITSNAPLIFVYLILTVILLLNVSLLSIIGYIGTAIVGIFAFFNFILGFLNETTIRDDRKSWAITSIIGVWIAIEIIVLMLIGGSIFNDIYTKPNSNFDYKDVFDW